MSVQLPLYDCGQSSVHCRVNVNINTFNYVLMQYDTPFRTFENWTVVICSYVHVGSMDLTSYLLSQLADVQEDVSYIYSLSKPNGILRSMYNDAQSEYQFRSYHWYGIGTNCHKISYTVRVTGNLDSIALVLSAKKYYIRRKQHMEHILCHLPYYRSMDYDCDTSASMQSHHSNTCLGQMNQIQELLIICAYVITCIIGSLCHNLIYNAHRNNFALVVTGNDVYSHGTFLTCFSIPISVLTTLILIRYLYIKAAVRFKRKSIRSPINFSISTADSIGGGHLPLFTFNDIYSYLDSTMQMKYKHLDLFEFTEYRDSHSGHDTCSESTDKIFVSMPLESFLPLLTIKQMKYISKIHRIHMPSKLNGSKMYELLRGHSCTACKTYMVVFMKYIKPAEKERIRYNALTDIGKTNAFRTKCQYQKQESVRHLRTAQQREKRRKLKITHKTHDFPPPPPSQGLQEQIIREWCMEITADNIEEAGCAVCGQLVTKTRLKSLPKSKGYLDVLQKPGMGLTRRERHSNDSPIEEINGPVFDTTCSHVCDDCDEQLLKASIPKYALANGLWIGKVPVQLKNLSFAEQMLISRVRHNSCIVRVSSGLHKMRANIIMFENPTPLIYQALPPSIDQLDDVLAFIFTGPCKPTSKDMERTPLLV